MEIVPDDLPKAEREPDREPGPPAQVHFIEQGWYCRGSEQYAVICWKKAFCRV